MTKIIFFSEISFISVILNYCYGSDRQSLNSLILFMGVDFILGLLTAIYKKSNKTKSGKLNSFEMWKGLLKKFGTLVICFLAFRMDIILNLDMVFNACVMAFIVNEALSIIENCERLGVKIPKKLSEILDTIND